MILRGAWSLSGRPIENLLSGKGRKILPVERENRAKEVEVVSGPLWLICAGNNLYRSETEMTAWEGFISLGSKGASELSEIMEAPSDLSAIRAPAGHYVSVRAIPLSQKLILYRDPTGGERLYFSIQGELLFFAASLKDLLDINPALTRKLNPDASFERGISELIHFGDGTLVDGVREVLPGHKLTAQGKDIRQSYAWTGLLEPLQGDVPSLARNFRQTLKSAVERCIGRDGKAAVALSGGADSATVAALACEVVGAKNVCAISYEYQDPTHPSEISLAKEICRRLGIAEHRIAPISFDDFLAAAPEAVWLAEDPGYWKRSYPMALAKAARAAGFDRFLTGFGIGSHMGYLEQCSDVIARLPLPQWSLRYWRIAREHFSARLPWLERIHPGLAPPIHRLYYPMLCVLRLRGTVRDVRPFFPPEIGSRVEQMLRSSRILEEWRSFESLALFDQLKLHAFIHMNSCADVVRCERVSREIGAQWLGPAHFPSCIPYCYLPLHAVPPLPSSRHHMRPGKVLLHEAMRDVLPEAVFRQKKNWTQTIGSRTWRDRVLAKMDIAAGPSWEALRAVFGSALDDAKRFAPEGIIPLAFWHRVVLSERRSCAPTWHELA